jgi:hypothetical protein
MTQPKGKDLRTAEDKANAAYNRELRRTEVLALFSRGYPPNMIARELGCHVTTVEKDIERGTQQLLRYFAEPKVQHTFIRYAAFNLSVIEKLQLLYESFMADNSEKKNYSAAVGSLKAQSDVLDKVIDRGMEWGVIDKRKASRAVHRTKGDLQQELQHQIRALQDLLSQVTDRKQTKPVTTQKTTKSKGHTRIVRKVRRDAYGIVYLAQSWMFKSRARKHKPQDPDKIKTQATQKTTTTQITITEELQQLQQIKSSPRPTARKKPRKKVIDVQAEVVEPKQLPDGKTWAIEPTPAP